METKGGKRRWGTLGHRDDRELILQRESYLQVPVDDPHVVEILHRVQNLVDELAGVSLRVEALFHDPVKQLATRHPAKGERLG